MNRALVLQIHSPFRVPNLPLKPGMNRLGRSSECELIVNDFTVSRTHAEITVVDDGLIVLDLSSRNGTFVNGQRVHTKSVDIGHQLQFGRVCFLLIDLLANEGEPNSEAETPCVRRDADIPDQQSYDTLLTVAKRRVLNMLMEGLAEKEIAGHLRLSQHTVHNDIRAIYKLLNFHSKSELLAHFLRKKDKLEAPSAKK